MKHFYLVFSYIFFVVSLSAQNTLERINDPIVVEGSHLNCLLGSMPFELVGFRFEDGNWVQVPVQVDERILLDMAAPYGPLASEVGYPLSSDNLEHLFYCDSLTHVGNDLKPAFDKNDELVFMARDAGSESDGSIPEGVVDSTESVIRISDPLGGEAYLYLYRSNSELAQDAGLSYLNYSSDLHSTSGFPAHAQGRNPENTLISSTKYSWGFSAEWVSDAFKLVEGNNTNILDRHKSFFADGNCARSEDTFSDGKNAFIAVKAGPIRIIRSVMGANSGILTQRTSFFYEGRLDIITDLRVHIIPSIYDAFDYNSNASGMIYYNDLNPDGVTIDGVQDEVNRGVILWEQLSGIPGTVSILHRMDGSFAIPDDGTLLSYYDDNSSLPSSNCTGDGEAWGTSGTSITFNLVCTDPLDSNCGPTPAFRTLKFTRVVYPDAPDAGDQMASNYSLQYDSPLELAITSDCAAPLGGSISEEEWKLYPNPTSGILYIDWDSYHHAEIYSLQGVLLLSSSARELNISHLDTGFYLVVVLGKEGERINSRIVKD